MARLQNEFRHIWRRLLRSPLFTAMTLLTLAIGIGANAAIFSIIEAVLLKPLPFPDPDALVAVWHTAPGINVKDLDASPSTYFTYRQENRTFTDIGLWNEGNASVTGVAEPEQVVTLYVTDGVLPTLGVKPHLGHTFTKKEDSPGSPDTAILTYGYWQAKFAGQHSVIGRRIVIDGKAREIVGVLPQGFQLLSVKPAILMPLKFEHAQMHHGNFSFRGVARLKPGITLQQANADVARMLPIWMRSFPSPPGYSSKMFTDARIGPNLRPLKEDLVGDVGTVLWLLMGAVGMVLLIACANVANLLLVRSEARQQELSIRSALGAGSGQIARELLLESVSLGLAGGALGLCLAYAALRALIAAAPGNLPRIEDISIDPQVLLFTFSISLFAGVLFGLIPVLKYAGPNLATSLRAGGRTLSQSRERHRARNMLVVIQVALALVLLIGSGLMLRTYQALRNVNPGFTRPEQLQTMQISIPEAQVKEPERVLRMEHDILRKLEGIAGVESAAFTSLLPLDGSGWNDPIFVENRNYPTGQMPPLRRFKVASAGYFKTLGTRVVAGRAFSWSDSYDKLPVVVISENMARELWQAPEAAIGKRIRETMTPIANGGGWRQIVGVVADVRSDGLTQKAPSSVYLPTLMKKFAGEELMVRRDAAFVIRTPRTGTQSLLSEMQKAVWSVNPNLPIAQVRTLEQLYRKSIARTSLTMIMLLLSGAMAMLLGVVGIYGVISYSVSQRTREIGIRMAVGAQRQQLTGMFVQQGLILGAVGVVLGLAVAIGMSKLMATLLYDVSPMDGVTYAAVSVGLAAATVLASYFPARRVSLVDPVEALRAE